MCVFRSLTKVWTLCTEMFSSPSGDSWSVRVSVNVHVLSQLSSAEKPIISEVVVHVPFTAADDGDLSLLWS